MYTLRQHKTMKINKTDMVFLQYRLIKSKQCKYCATVNTYLKS